MVSPGGDGEGMEDAIVGEGSGAALAPGLAIHTGGGFGDVVAPAFAGLLTVEVITGGHSRSSFDHGAVLSSRFFFSSGVLVSMKRDRGGTVSRTRAGPRRPGGAVTGAGSAVTTVSKTGASV